MDHWFSLYDWFSHDSKTYSIDTLLRYEVLKSVSPITPIADIVEKDWNTKTLETCDPWDNSITFLGEITQPNQPKDKETNKENNLKLKEQT